MIYEHTIKNNGKPSFASLIFREASELFLYVLIITNFAFCEAFLKLKLEKTFDFNFFIIYLFLKLYVSPTS